MKKCDICDIEVKQTFAKGDLWICAECLNTEIFCRGCGEHLTNEYYQNEEWCKDCL